MADLPKIANCIAANRAESRPARLLIDLTQLLGKDGKAARTTLTEGAVAWLQELLRSSTSTARVELIYLSNKAWRHARTEAARLLALPESHALPDALAAIYAEDIVLSLVATHTQQATQDHTDAVAALRLRITRLLTLAEDPTSPSAADISLASVGAANARDLLHCLAVDRTVL